VEEGDEFFAGSFEGDFVDQFGALLAGVVELAVDVIRGEGDVVDAAGRVFFEEFGDGAVVRGGFEEFEVDIACGEEGGADLLGFDFLTAFAGEAEDLLVVGDGFVEGADGDAEVVDFGDHGGVGRGRGSGRGVVGRHG
jgi:hypothetical protein